MNFVADRVDAALEWSVVGSFSRLGSALRRRLEHWVPLDGRRLAGRAIVITGATSGLGYEAARTLAGLGASVEVIAGRLHDRCTASRRPGAPTPPQSVNASGTGPC